MATREIVWSSSQEELRDTPIRPLNPFAEEIRPKEHLLSNLPNVQFHQKLMRISCAIKVEGCEIRGSPFVPNDAACALFSADTRPGEMPCLRLDFDFHRVSKPRIDSNAITRPTAGSRTACPRVNAGPSPPADLLLTRLLPYAKGACTEHGQLLVSLTVRWCSGHMVDLLDYSRAVEPPRDWIGDAEVFQLCPEPGIMERLIRMTWVSTYPMFGPKYGRRKKKLASDFRANLVALYQHKSKKIMI